MTLIGGTLDEISTARALTAPGLHARPATVSTGEAAVRPVDTTETAAGVLVRVARTGEL